MKNIFDSSVYEADESDVRAYKRVMTSRAKGRPTGKDYIDNLISDFIELHGDRHTGDDPAVITGIGKLKNMPVTVIAIEKGHSTKEKIKRNFGSMHPEGYRKALRQMKLAEKFARPVICIVDTSGAYCGIEAEERGQGQAIAENLVEMMRLKTPIVSLFIGEGGSGGALGLAVADKVWMLENSYYSVISPEGCASILWKDSKKMKEAAQSLRLTAYDLKDLGIAEKIITEPENLKDFKRIYYFLEDLLFDEFSKSKELSTQELLERRYEKFRKIGRIQGL
ncbi:MAG: acetyl-CoA carboxylase carboxyltransferase subunit alpha [Eubacteriales bacterium]|nr:acetyl-CoA carboxylase carboxyltransferase subunit alpha [Eubacteriales bacterium]MDD4391037.1 acetyl-CoA carboxylase carboxyltransferase subunit alpha [Eubacteriales bacterium]